jgi:hypothetical protein
MPCQSLCDAYTEPQANGTGLHHHSHINGTSCTQAILEDLHTSRQVQQAVKLTQQAEMAQHEKNEFERIIEVNRAKEEREAQLAQKVHP